MVNGNVNEWTRSDESRRSDNLLVELDHPDDLLDAALMPGEYKGPIEPKSIFASPDSIADQNSRVGSLRLRKWLHLLLSAALLSLQVVVVQQCEGQMSHQTAHTTTIEIVLTALITSVQACVAMCTVWFQIKNRALIRLNDIWVHYIAQLLNFAGIYFFCFILKRSIWWRMPDCSQTTNSNLSVNSPWTIAFTFIYFSAQTQTLVGYGDIAPTTIWPAVPTTVQMLLGILYISLFISNTVAQLEPTVHEAQPYQLVAGAGGLQWYVRCRQWLRSHLVLLMIILLVFKVAALHWANACILQYETASTDSYLLAYGMLLFSWVELLAICLVSFKFVRKDKAHLATLSFVIQAYLSIITLFVGIFLTCLAFDSQSWQLSWNSNMPLGNTTATGSLAMKFGSTISHWFSGRIQSGNALRIGRN